MAYARLLIFNRPPHEGLLKVERREFRCLGVWVFRFWGLGFGVWGLGFRVWGSGFGVWGLGFRIQGFRVQLFRCFGVWGLRVQTHTAHTPDTDSHTTQHNTRPGLRWPGLSRPGLSRTGAKEDWPKWVIAICVNHSPSVEWSCSCFFRTDLKH